MPRLDGLNPVFGRVESGMDTVIRLSQVSVGLVSLQHTHRDTPAGLFGGSGAGYMAAR